MGKLLAFLVVVMALLGTPLFAIMGGSSELLWLMHDNPNLCFLRFIAPNVLDDRFAGSPILVTNAKKNGAGITLTSLGTGVAGSFDAVVDQFDVRDQLGHGLRVILPGPERVSGNEDGLRYWYYDQQEQVGWAEIHLPTEWAATQAHTLHYTLVPF